MHDVQVRCSIGTDAFEIFSCCNHPLPSNETIMDFSVSLVHVTVCKCSLLTTGYFSLCFLKLILNFKKVPYRLLFSMIINHYQLQSLQLLYKVYKGEISVILVVNKIVLRYIIFVIIKFRN